MMYEKKLMYEAIGNNIKTYNDELNKHQLYRNMLDLHIKFNHMHQLQDILEKLNKLIIKDWKLIWIDYPEIYMKRMLQRLCESENLRNKWCYL